MEKQTVTIKVGYGVLCDTIEKQLNEQGFTLVEKAESFERLKKSFYTLVFSDLISDSEHGKILKRLHKQVIKECKQLEEKTHD